jgi:hypothetical protein
MTQKSNKQQVTSSATKKAKAEILGISTSKEDTNRNRLLSWDQLYKSPNDQDSTNLSPGIRVGIGGVSQVLKRIFYSVFKILYGLTKVCVSSISMVRSRFNK